jgi:hypothetical protein
MSGHERARFVSPNRISELVSDSENKVVGAWRHSLSYFGNRILCIFGKPLKYLRLSYSSLDERYMYRLSIPPRKYTLKMMAQFGRLWQNSTKICQPRFVRAAQLKYRVWTASCVKKKSVSEVLRKWGVCVWSKIIISDTTKPRHISTNLQAEIPCACIGSETET